MPDTFGKRQRREAQAKKIAAREDRRLARNKRRQEGDASSLGGRPSWLAPPPEFGAAPASVPRRTGTSSRTGPSEPPD